jgi:cell division protein ZapA
MGEAKTQSLDVTIMGRGYKVACAPDEREALMRAVAYLDAKMGEIHDSGRVGNAERIAVMAALNITHEYLNTRISDDLDVGRLKQSVRSMHQVLDEALAPQQPLF